MISQAPQTFFTLLTVGWLVGWGFIRLYYRHHHAERIAVLEQRVALHKATAEQGGRGEVPSSLPGVFIVQHLKHEFYWQQGQSQMQRFPPLITVPQGAKVILQMMVRITAPSLLVEYVDLAVMNQRLRSDWEPRMDESIPYYERYVYVDLPQRVSAGRHRVRLIAGSGEREQSSIEFDIEVPRI